MNKTIRALSCCSLLALEWVAFGAEVPVPDDTVAQRVRPELQPVGVRVGAFTVLPGVTTEVRRDDNVYAQSTDTISDTVLVARPEVEVRSNWSRHSARVKLRADAGRYRSRDSENYTDVALTANGRVELRRDSGLLLSGRIEALHEDRFSPDDRNGLTPVEFDRSGFGLGYERSAGRVSLRIDGGLSRLDYENVAGVDGEINHDDRDRDLRQLGVRVGYKLRSGVELFARAGISSIDYDDAFDDSGVARSSNNREFGVGAEFDVNSRLSVAGFVGRTQRDLDDVNIDNIDASWFGADVVWRLSGLTTVSAAARRTIDETALAGAGAAVATRVSAGVDHELLRNLVVSASVYRQEIDFRGIDRSDDVFGKRFAIDYMMNRNVGVLLDYQHRDRDVTGVVNDGLGFDINTLSLSVTGRL